ncbi:MAG: type II toxin-antitoxin system HicB family antitoxin, partial [Nanoarchaeota archaeon]
MFKLFKKENPRAVKTKYNIPKTIKLSTEITPDGWFLVTSPELPGLITQARTAKELLEMVNDAILTYYDVP